MKPHLFQADITVKKSPISGYGVFAGQDFQPGDLIEECYALLTDVEAFPNYVFQTDNELSAIPLGYGCIYNHAVAPNANYKYDPAHQVIIFEAKKLIRVGEEILISYGSGWFSKRNLSIKYPLRYRLRKIFPKTVYRFILLTAFIACFIAVFGNTRPG